MNSSIPWAILSIFYLILLHQSGRCFDLEENAKTILETVVRPILRVEPRFQRMQNSPLRLCKCSVDYGCHGRTQGYLAGLFHGRIHKKLIDRYRELCFTDGMCYQSIGSGHNSETGYGCIDISEQERDIHLEIGIAMTFCNNSTEEEWICCTEKSFCANQTVLPPLKHQDENETGTTDENGLVIPPSHLFTHIHFVSITSLLLLIAVAGLLSYITYRYKWYRKVAFITHTPESNSSRLDRPGAAPSTVQTSLGSSVNLNQEESFSYSQLVSAERIEENAGFMNKHDMELVPIMDSDQYAEPNPMVDNICAFLDTYTSGSGSTGPVYLQKKTLTHEVRISGETVGEGRFGTVLSGMWRGDKVAVKIFKSSDEPSYNREVEIYQTQMLRHENILKFMGHDRSDSGHETTLMIMTEFHENGSIFDYLQENTVNLEQAYRILYTAAQGLAFLHTEIAGLEGSAKPQIAHRDIKSRNILLKKDLTCAIGDFGLSVLYDSYTGQMEPSANASERCGTVRYLAPEILGDKMQDSLFDAYKMADIYAFALVMWEVLSRTDGKEETEQGELWKVMACSKEQMIPYEGYLGRDPSVEEMRQVVYEQRKRPSLNPYWAKFAGFNNISCMIRECWNPIPTARLTAVQIRKKLEKNKVLIIGPEGLKSSILDGNKQANLEDVPLSPMKNFPAPNRSQAHGAGNSRGRGNQNGRVMGGPSRKGDEELDMQLLEEDSGSGGLY